MYIHCIIKDEAVVDAIRSFETIRKVTWDKTFDTAVHWSESNLPEPPSLIFCEEFAYNSQLDLTSGKFNKDKLILEALKQLRFNLPNSRVVILLQQNKKKNETFLQHLVSLGIYDFHFVEQFGIEELEGFINTQPRNLKDVSEYITTVDIDTDQNEDKKTSVFTDKESEPAEFNYKEAAVKVLHDFKSKFARKVFSFTKKDSDSNAINSVANPVPVVEQQVPQAPQVPSVMMPHKNDVQEKKEHLIIYAFDVDTQDKQVIVFNEWSVFLAGCQGVPPDVVLLSADCDTLADKIAQLREVPVLLEALIVTVGKVDKNEILEAGADDSFEVWDKLSYQQALNRKKRLINLKKEAIVESTKDQLTGLFTRKIVEDYLAKQTEIYHYTKEPFSILFADLDYFKKINDTFGHQLGDAVLKEFASHLSGEVRKSDLVGRYGGEEFVVIFPGTTKDIAKKVSIGLKNNWQKKGIYNTTFSGGVAEYGVDTEDLEQLIKYADEALYKAKRSGRNMIISHGETGEKQEKFEPITYKDTQTKVYMVVGANHRVGATSFSLVLAHVLNQKYPVELLDAGGGSSKWIARNESFPVKIASISHITPRVITIIDAGVNMPQEYLPFTEAVFLVTDLSKNAVYIKDFVGPKTYLVGTRDAPFDGLKELAEIWGINVLCTLEEEASIRKAELQGVVPKPSKWIKKIKKYV